MADKAFNLTFPIRGNDHSTAIQSQPPYSTIDSLNVRAFDVMESRGRGGSRPALSRAFETQLGSGNPIRFAVPMNSVQSDNFDFWGDTFDGRAFSSVWSQAQFAALPTLETVRGLTYVAANGTIKRGMVVAGSVTPDFSATRHRVEIYLVPYQGRHAGTFYLYSRMNVDNPLVDSIEAEITFNSLGGYTLVVSKYVASTKTVLATATATLSDDGLDGWLAIENTSATTVKVTWRGTVAYEGAVPAAAGNNFGFALKAATDDDKVLVDRFRIQYYHATRFELSRPRVHATSNGLLYREKWLNTFENIPSLSTLGSDRRLWATELNNQLIIADYGDPIAGAADGVLTTTTLESATYPDWSAISGLSIRNHSIQIISGTTATGPNTLTAMTFPILTIGTTTLSLGGVAPGVSATAVVFRIVRNPKVFTPSDNVILDLTGGTTDSGGTLLSAVGMSLPTGYTYKDVIVKIISGTGVTPGLYAASASGSGNITLTTSAGSSASSVVFQVLPMSLQPLTSVYPGADPGSPSDDVQKGFIPVGCRIVARHMASLIWAGDPSAPQAFYLSRQGDAKDYDFSQEDDQAAYAGATGEIGRVPDPIVDVIPWYRRYTFLACRSSLHLLIDNPRKGGSVEEVSSNIGLAIPGAWCIGPNSELVFLSRDGLYITNTSCMECQPEALSRGKLPLELIDLSESQVEVAMAYDVRDQGVHIYLTYKHARSRVVHWWFDLTTKGFFPVNLETDFEPTAICYYPAVDAEDDCVLLAGRDGRIRRYRDFCESDDGWEFESYVALGPFWVGSAITDATLNSIRGCMAADSGDTHWFLFVGKSPEEVVDSYFADPPTPVVEGEFGAGFSRNWNPLRRAAAGIVKIVGTGTAWAMESISLISKQLGQFR